VDYLFLTAWSEVETIANGDCSTRDGEGQKKPRTIYRHRQILRWNTRGHFPFQSFFILLHPGWKGRSGSSVARPGPYFSSKRFPLRTCVSLSAEPL